MERLLPQPVLKRAAKIYRAANFALERGLIEEEDYFIMIREGQKIIITALQEI